MSFPPPPPPPPPGPPPGNPPNRDARGGSGSSAYASGPGGGYPPVPSQQQQQQQPPMMVMGGQQPYLAGQPPAQQPLPPPARPQPPAPPAQHGHAPSRGFPPPPAPPGVSSSGTSCNFAGASDGGNNGSNGRYASQPPPPLPPPMQQVSAQMGNMRLNGGNAAGYVGSGGYAGGRYPPGPPPPGTNNTAMHMPPPPPGPPSHMHVQGGGGGNMRPPPPGPPTMMASSALGRQQYQQQQYPQQQQQTSLHAPPPPPPPPMMPGQQYPQQQYPEQQSMVKPHQVERINPSQIPRVPCFTRPDGHPARVYHTKRAVLGDVGGVGGGGSGGGYPTNYDGGYGGPNPTGWDASGGSSFGGGGGGGPVELRAPPPADSRYVVVDDGNASPRLIRSTCFAFPRTRGVSEKVGVPLGLLCTPLGVGSDGFVSRVVGGSLPPKDNANGETDGGTVPNQQQQQQQAQRYEAQCSLESVPLIRSAFPGGGPVRPHRCPRCQAYLNPFCRNPYVDAGSMIRGASLTFTCNMCGHHARVDAVVDVNDPAYSLDLTAAATRYGTVEYELGGTISPEYVTRNGSTSTGDGDGNGSGLGPVRQVLLFGIDTAPDEEMGDMVQYYANAVRRVALEIGDWWTRQGEEIRRGPAPTTSSGRDGGAGSSNPGGDGSVSTHDSSSHDPRVGFFLYQSDRIIIPHYRKRFESRADHLAPHVQDGISGEVAGTRRHASHNDEELELTVAVMADVVDDPFSPLPCYDFTYDVTDSLQMRRLDAALDAIPSLVKDCFPDNRQLPQHERGRSCGGAALAVLSSALSTTGGRGVLLTSHRPNFGVGTLRDREAGGAAKHYQQIQSEKELYTPLQHLVKRQISFASASGSDGTTTASSNTNTSASSKGGSEMASATFYTKLGATSATDRVVLDILVSTPLVENGAAGAVGTGQPRSRFLDVATLSELCRNTCGKFRWLKLDSDNCQGYSQTLSEEIIRSATAFSGNDAIFKVRCSSGVEVESFLPMSQTPGVLVDDSVLSSPELELSTVSSDTCVAIQLRHKIGGIPKESGSSRDPMVFFQTALLYTTSAGSRRVRVSTLALQSTSVPSEVFRLSDFGAVTAFTTRQAISDMLRPDGGGTHKVAREAIVKRCVNLLANYRLNTSARNSPSGQLILPEALQLLPLFCLSLRKSLIFRPSLPKGSWSARPSPSADERAYHIHHGAAVSPALAMLSVHSNLYVVTKLRKRDGEWIVPAPAAAADEASIASASCRPYMQLPKSAHPSITSIDEDGIYLLDDGFVLYLYVGKAVPTDVRRDFLVFDNSSRQTPVVSSTSEAGRKLMNIAWQMRSFCSMGGAGASLLRPTTAPIVVILAGDGANNDSQADLKHRFLEDKLVTLLVDDTTAHETFYSDFLCQLHRQIQESIDKQ